MDTDFSTLNNKDVMFREIPCKDVDEHSLIGIGDLFQTRDFSRIETVHTPLMDAETGREIIISNDVSEKIINVMQDDGYIKIQTSGQQEYKHALIDPDESFKFILRDLQYTPHSSKTVMSVNSHPFIMILGTDLNKLNAFIFDGEHVIRINPRVWHSHPIIHYDGEVQFLIKKGIVDAEIGYDSVKENERWMYIDYG